MTTRPPRNSSASRKVIRWGPRTWVASVSSWPCSVVVRVGGSTPALCTRACSDVMLAVRLEQKSSTDSTSLTSQTAECRRASGCTLRIRLSASSSRSALRPSRCTSAPRPAIAPAAASPSPLLAPVTTTCLPSSTPAGGSAGHQ